MVSKIWMVNGVLAVALVLCWINIWEVWQTDTAMFPAAMSAEKSKGFKPFKAPPENAILSDAEYQSVVDRNLFSSERTAPPPEAAKTGTEPVEDELRISGEKITLYGVVLFGDYKAALINNPEDKAKGAQNKWVKEGDSIGNLQVREIRQDQVVLADSETSYRVLLYDPEKIRKASASPKSAPSSQPKIVSVGDAPKPASAEPPKPKKSGQLEKVTISADGQYEIIDTPLGQIKRKRK
ncbi:MAG: hypothetical protein M0Z56_10415 [Desulfobacteraceae bacterium]|nr:hypothetical protein [Desulfobacteraceae bacterium]